MHCVSCVCVLLYRRDLSSCYGGREGLGLGGMEMHVFMYHEQRMFHHLLQCFNFFAALVSLPPLL